MACQVSFPNMSALPLRHHRGSGCGGLCRLRSLTGGQLLPDYLLEQSSLHRPIGIRAHVLALLEEAAVGGIIEYRTLTARGRRPASELLRRHGLHVERHAREAVAAEVRRETEVNPGAVGLQVEASRHAVHGVDLASQLRH